MSACSAFRQAHGDPAAWSARTIDGYLDACLADRDNCPAVQAETVVVGQLAKEATQ